MEPQGSLAAAESSIADGLESLCISYGKEMKPRGGLAAAESTLAHWLKSLCTSYGKERTATLLQSAEILMQLGNIYLQKADTATDAMSQKLLFIQSCALLNGAKVRFQEHNESKKVGEADCHIATLIGKLFSKFNISAAATDMIDFMKIMQEMVQTMRNEMANELKKLKKIEDNTLGQERHEKEVEKIKIMQEISEETTKKYEHLMQKIANTCVKMLGKAPCKFAGVGLGSLARKEVTLYSDFEHVIILEEGVQTCENYKKIQEYFRRFAVLFQVALINLGETFIRSVGVPCLNDLYSDDPAKDWFYDNHTPSGISFDGMVPHSCHNPLGRQQPTKARQHVVELIQPAEAMAKYLSSAQGVKNGYYLKDILARTCMVYGDAEVYEIYIEAAAQILSHEKIGNVAKDLAKKINENVNRDVGHEPSFEGAVRYLNMKSKMYRPVTGLLAYLGHTYRIFTSSTYDLIHELSSREIINKKARHDLQFAVSIACEVRLKVYDEGGHQRYNIPPDALLEMIGKQTEVDFRETLDRLREFTKKMVLGLWIKGGMMEFVARSHIFRKFDFRPGDPKSKLYSLMELCQYEEATELCEKLCDTDNDQNMQLHCFLGKMYRRMGYQELNIADFQLDMAEATTKNLVQKMVVFPENRHEIFHPQLSAALLRSKMTTLDPASIESKILSAIEHEQYQEAYELIHNNTKNLDSGFDANVAVLTQYGIAKQCKQTCNKWWKKGEKVLRHILEHAKYIQNETVFDLAFIYRHQKRYMEADALFQKYSVVGDESLFSDKLSQMNFNIHHGADMQIRRHIMPTKEFLKYLLQNLRKKRHIETRFRTLREIAMVRIKLGQHDLAKRILHNLVNEINNNIRCLRDTFPVWFLNKIMAIQRDQKWTQDALETVELMLDLSGDDCKQDYMGHSRYQMPAWINKFAMLADTEQDDAAMELLEDLPNRVEDAWNKDRWAARFTQRKAAIETSMPIKVKLAEDLIRICAKYPDNKRFQGLHVEAFMILSVPPELFSDMVRIYRSAPPAIRHHKALRGPVFNFLHHHVSNQSSAISARFSQGLRFDRIHELLKHFFDSLLEPVIFYMCRHIHFYMIATRRELLLPYFDNLNREFVSKFSVRRHTALSKPYNYALWCFLHHLYITCAETSWRIINSSADDTFPKRISISFLYTIILFYI